MDVVKFLIALLIPLVALGVTWGARQAQIDDLYVREQELRTKLEQSLELSRNSEREEAKWRMEVMVKLAHIETKLAHIEESLRQGEESRALWPEGYTQESTWQGYPSEVYPPLQTCVQ